MANADVIAGEGDKINDTADYDSESITNLCSLFTALSLVFFIIIIELFVSGFQLHF